MNDVAAIYSFSLNTSNNNDKDASFRACQCLLNFHFLLKLKTIRNEWQHKLMADSDQNVIFEL